MTAVAATPPPSRQERSSSYESLTTIDSIDHRDEVCSSIPTTTETVSTPFVERNDNIGTPPPPPPPPPPATPSSSTAALLLSYANSTHQRLSSHSSRHRRSSSGHSRRRNLRPSSTSQSPSSQHHHQRRRQKQQKHQQQRTPTITERKKKKSSSFQSSASSNTTPHPTPPPPSDVLARSSSHGITSATSHSYTEHTIYDDEDDDEYHGYEEFADLEDNDAMDEGSDDDNSILSSSPSSRVVVDWNDSSDVYYSDSDLPNQQLKVQHQYQRQHDHHRTSRTPPRTLQRERSDMSLSCHTLSSAFTLNDLNSVGTVSSLEADGDDANIDHDHQHVVDEIEEFVEDGNLISVEGVGILSLRMMPSTPAISGPHQPQEQQQQPHHYRTPPSSRRRRKHLAPTSSRLTKTPKSYDTVDDTCSLDSDDRRIRQIEQKVEALHLRETFSNHHYHHHNEKHQQQQQQQQQEEDATHTNEDDDIIEEEILEEVVEEEEYEELIVEDTEVEEVQGDEDEFHEDESDNCPLNRPNHHIVSTPLHSSIAANVTNSQQQQQQRQHSTNVTSTAEEENGYRERNDSFPSKLSDAKEYLARLASSRMSENQSRPKTSSTDGEWQRQNRTIGESLDDPSTTRPQRMRRNESSEAYTTSSDDYTEVVMSSDDDGAVLGKQNDIQHSI